MKLSPLTIKRLSTRIIGDDGPFPRLKGEAVLQLFNQVGFKDIYDFHNGGMPDGVSRKTYAFEKMKEINGSDKMLELIEILGSKPHYLGSEFDIQDSIKELNTILQVDNYEFVGSGQANYKIAGAQRKEEVKVKAHFEQNRDKIIAEIKNAKFLIWVAVAWLTDTVLLTELRKKKEEGLNIQIVTQDDEINKRLKVAVEKIFEAYYKAPIGVYKNLMHHKFCIIDLKTVVHGSYNWTTKAQYNEETVTVVQSADIAIDFAETFMKLKNAGKR